MLSLSLLSSAAFGQGKEPINTLPRYGSVPKTPALRKLDQQFVNSSLRQYHNDRRAASEGCVSQGWSHLYDSDLTTSMKRFNQAWLLDSTNCNVYYGFSACLSERGHAKPRRQQIPRAAFAVLSGQAAAHYTQQQRVATLRSIGSGGETLVSSPLLLLPAPRFVFVFSRFPYHLCGAKINNPHLWAVDVSRRRERPGSTNF
jgi:hypothetical protein